MKNILFLMLIGFLFFCSSYDRKQEFSEKNTDNFKLLDTLIHFSGYWVSEAYYNNLQQFKSPKKAQEGAQFIFIPDRTLQQTSMIYNFHEGGDFLKVVKHGNSYEVWEVQEDSLTQRLYNIEWISSKKIKLDNTTFVKINPLKNHDTYLILEEILFKGKFTNADQKTIEFKPNGQVTGLGNFTFYSPQIDYFGAGNQVDQVGLGSSPDNLDWFGFKFNKDTLEIYTITCLTFDSTDNVCVDTDYGQLSYKLWRKK
ncbi:MAG: hypothetical protein ACK4R6_11740 [Spirosomataceae bacterium]